MIAVSALVIAAAIYILYDAAFETQKARLIETAKGRARMIEAVAFHNHNLAVDMGFSPAIGEKYTINQIIAAHRAFGGFGETGEFTLARRSNDEIDFIPRHRDALLEKPPSIPFSGKLAEPMRLALAKQSGAIVGLDHRGATVLAAFEPVADLDLGLVVKIDLEEIREPFVRAALIVTIIALSAIGGGATIFSKIAFPLARRIESDKALLRLLEGKYESIVEDHPGLIRRFTPDGTLSFANQAYAATFGKPPENIVGTNIFDLVPAEERDGLRTVVDDLSPNAPIINHENRTTSNTGRIRHTTWTSHGFFDNQGTLMEIQSSGLDITDLREAKRELWQVQKAESLGTLAGGIAHEINNLLLPIIALGEMTLDDLPEDHRGRVRLRKILEAGNRARRLVERILAFSHKDDLIVHDFDMAAVVKEALELLRSTTPSTITMNQPASFQPLIIEGNPTEIHALLINLGANAVDALEGRPGLIDVQLEGRKANATLAGDVPGIRAGRRYAHLRFEDNGRGIPEAIVDRVFDPFFTTKGVGEGTGLGLALARSIVEKHHGVVRLRSKVKKGTTFDIYLPLVENEDIARSPTAGRS